MTEIKFLDVAVNHEVNTTGYDYCLSGLLPGNTASTRIGSRVAIQSIQLSLKLTPHATTASDSRVLLVVDRQANGAQAAGTDYLVSDSLTGLKNLASRMRFRTLMDKKVAGLPLATNSNYGGGRPLVIDKFVKFSSPLSVDYNAGTAGTVADIITNNVFLHLVGSTAAGSGATLTGNIRVRYSDF